MLWFGGIHGDKRLGMQQVQKTVDDGHYLKPFAQDSPGALRSPRKTGCSRSENS